MATNLVFGSIIIVKKSDTLCWWKKEKNAIYLFKKDEKKIEIFSVYSFNLWIKNIRILNSICGYTWKEADAGK